MFVRNTMRLGLARAAAVALALWSGAAYAADVSPDTQVAFVAVMDSTLAQYGKFPIDRKYYAQAIDEAADAGAKAVALKFFFETPGPSDLVLAKAMRRLPVAIQFSLRDVGTPAARTDKVTSGTIDMSQIPNPFMAASAVMPVQDILEAARTGGFVDMRLDPENRLVETVGLINGRPMESLQLAILELIVGQPAMLKDHSLMLGHGQRSLDDTGRTQCGPLAVPQPKIIPLEDFLAHKYDKDAIAGKVVVVGYMAADTPRIKMRTGQQMPIHEYFFREVDCLSRGIRS